MQDRLISNDDIMIMDLVRHMRPSTCGRWNGARCPELVAGSGKQVEVVVMSNDVQEVSTMGHVVVGQVTLSQRRFPN